MLYSIIFVMIFLSSFELIIGFWQRETRSLVPYAWEEYDFTSRATNKSTLASWTGNKVTSCDRSVGKYTGAARFLSSASAWKNYRICTPNDYNRSLKSAACVDNEIFKTLRGRGDIFPFLFPFLSYLFSLYKPASIILLFFFALSFLLFHSLILTLL